MRDTNHKKAVFYRVGGAVLLLIVGVVAVMWAARSRFSRSPTNRPPSLSEGPMNRLPGTPSPSGSLSTKERRYLLDLARRTVRDVVTNGTTPTLDPSRLPPRLTQKKGCFVTLKKNGKLRGCIGYIFPVEPLYRAVIDNARNAAIKDRRFDPVQPSELKQIEIEVSVLTPPEPLEFDSPEDLLGSLRPNVDGVVLRIRRRQSVFLPQVWEQLPDKETFLAHLSAKAGCPPQAWKEPGTSVLTYQVEAFKESEM